MLHCPRGHQWNAPSEVDRGDRACSGECPECGELVAIGCSLVQHCWRRTLVSVVLLLAPPLAWVILIWKWQARQRLAANHELIYLLALILGIVSYWIGLQWLAVRRERRAMHAAADLLHLQPVPNATSVAAKEFGSFPLFSVATSSFGGHATCCKMFTGDIRGEPVAVMTVAFPTGRTTFTQSVLVFRRVIEGLPDFELVPERHVRSIAANVPNVFGFRMAASSGNPPAAESWITRLEFALPKPHGVQLQFQEPYLLSSSDPGRAEKIVTPELGTALRDLRDWVVQARHGELLFFQPDMRCLPPLLGTMLATTFRIQQIFVRVALGASAGDSAQPSDNAQHEAPPVVESRQRGLLGSAILGLSAISYAGATALMMIPQPPWGLRATIGGALLLASVQLAVGAYLIGAVLRDRKRGRHQDSVASR